MTADTPFPTPPSAPASSPAGFRVDVFPEVRRPDAGAVLIGEWDTGGPERQRAVMDGVARLWAEAPLPDGLLSRVLFAGTDGRSVLNYGQWTSHAARRGFLRTGAAGLTDRLAALLDGVGGVGTGGPGAFRLYASLPPGGEPPAPGCVVRTAFRTAREDTARRLVDGLLERADGRRAGDGAIASYFHLSEDGTRVVDYSEWADPQSHQRVVDTRLRDGGPVLRFLGGLDGVEPLGFRRFTAPRGLVRALPA
ncbi:antibiotic biosynthesis monooxygenase [Streptomyces noursei]|uniref:antibiotic biosynthesis monooxygenase n=1 Tax=Streptomyces noursei TaxID=1971 RepID=UPI0011AED07D|nr:antibiotic biosynthesis monooxygenase [Streptomyces noursei]